MPTQRPYYFPVWDSVRKPFKFLKYRSIEELHDTCTNCDYFMKIVQGFNVKLHVEMNASEYADFNSAMFYLQRSLTKTKLRYADEISRQMRQGANGPKPK